LNIPDVLKKEGALTAARLAEATGTKEKPLFRIMRLLSAFGVYYESANGEFSLNSLSEGLTDAYPRSLKGFMKSTGIWWDVISKLGETLKTGTEGSLLLWNKPMWEYFSENPELKQVFGQAMVSMSKPEIIGIIRCYDFSPYKKIVDVGGSMGHIVKAILKDSRYEKVTGINFDLPPVVEMAKKAADVEGYDYNGRLEFVGGDYTKEVPKGDCMLIKYCIHNVKDEQTVVDMLNACHKSCEEKGKLLLIEIILPEIGDIGGKWDKCMDILMLTVLNSKERTLSEFKELGAKCGWKFNRAIPVIGSNYSLHCIEFDKI
jgi:hypothetical protein